jgi:hypothetical protein
MNEDVGFESDVDRWIARALRAGPLPFADLVRVLPGVDPTFVRSRIEMAADDLRERVLWQIVRDAAAPGDPRLPVPHPLDFDWRFAPSTIGALSDELGSRDARLTLLGAPSLWLALQDRLPSDRMYLLDANPHLSKTALALDAVRQVLVLDVLSSDVPPLHSDVVLADPPWYPQALAGFLWVGSSLLRANGRLFLSTPPLGTRPGIQREREELLVLAERVGLTVRSTRPAALRYASPPFERAALRAAGLAAFLPTDWRQGDLLVFERTGDVAAPRPVSSERRWTERILDGVRIQIDDGAPATGTDPALVSLIDGDVLPSVSRRDARRGGVRVWTSGNRVFGCAAPIRLVEVLDGIIAGRALQRPEGLAATSIRALVRRERTEYICSDDGGVVVRSPP